MYTVDLADKIETFERFKDSPLHVLYSLNGNEFKLKMFIMLHLLNRRKFAQVLCLWQKLHNFYLNDKNLNALHNMLHCSSMKPN